MMSLIVVGSKYVCHGDWHPLLVFNFIDAVSIKSIAPCWASICALSLTYVHSTGRFCTCMFVESVQIMCETPTINLYCSAVLSSIAYYVNLLHCGGNTLSDKERTTLYYHTGNRSSYLEE